MATTDPSRRFDDVFNIAHDPTTLHLAWQRVATNRGARSAGSDDLTATVIAEEIGVSRFLNELREQLKTGTFSAQPVRERKIPKRGGNGKPRRLGIPTIADRVVQAAVKIVLEPIFEDDFLPVSYVISTGFGPNGGLTTRSLRFICLGPTGIVGSWMPISKRDLIGSIIPP